MKGQNLALYVKIQTQQVVWGQKIIIGVFMTAEALAFKFSQDAAPYAYSTAFSGSPDVITYSSWGDYQWGFRIAGGYNISHDKWDLVATFTRFDNSMTQSRDDDLTSNLSAYLNGAYAQLDPFSKVTNRCKINYNMLDIEQGRQFFISKYLRLSPKFGLRNLWLFHSQKLTAESCDIFTTTARENFGGISVLGGLDTVWHLARGLSLYGNLEASCLFGYVHPKTDVNNDTNQNIASV
jgi:Legionella pneumophila major outer membrane protein precursor